MRTNKKLSEKYKKNNDNVIGGVPRRSNTNDVLGTGADGGKKNVKQQRNFVLLYFSFFLTPPVPLSRTQLLLPQMPLPPTSSLSRQSLHFPKFLSPKPHLFKKRFKVGERYYLERQVHGAASKALCYTVKFSCGLECHN